MKKKIDIAVGGILKGNINVFISKIKNALINKIEERIFQLLDESLGTEELSIEQREQMKSIFSVDFKSEDLGLLDKELSPEMVAKHFTVGVME